MHALLNIFVHPFQLICPAKFKALGGSKFEDVKTAEKHHFSLPPDEVWEVEDSVSAKFTEKFTGKTKSNILPARERKNQGAGLIERVIFKIHPSFSPSTIRMSAAPYTIEKIGWGYFTCELEIEFVSECTPKKGTILVLTFFSFASLYLWGRGRLSMYAGL